MQNPQQTPASVAPLGKKPPRVKQTLCKRVREVLLSFGGEAHRSIVIEQVARKLGVSLMQVYLARHRVGKLFKAEVLRLRRETE